MKKILFLLTFALIVTVSVDAQTGSAYQFPIVRGDTLSTTNAFDSVFKYIPVTAGYSAIGIQVNAKITSGSLSATSRAYLFRSLDRGATYVLTDSAAYVTPTSLSTTTLPGAAKVATFNLVTSPAMWYAVCATSNAGTVVAPITVWYTAREYTRNNP